MTKNTGIQTAEGVIQGHSIVWGEGNFIPKKSYIEAFLAEVNPEEAPNIKSGDRVVLALETTVRRSTTAAMVWTEEAFSAL